MTSARDGLPEAEALEHLVELARSAAAEAAAVIAEAEPTVVDVKPGATSRAAAVVTDVDRRAETAIVACLAATLTEFGFGLLTEERPDDGGRRRTPAFWCIDPLDGTLPFVEGRPGSAVSIALVGRDGTPLLGVIHDLTGDRPWHAVRGSGAFRDGRRWSLAPSAEPSTGPLRLFADRSLLERPDASTLLGGVEGVASDLGLDGVDVRVGAGAVMNACGVLEEPSACYLKPPARAGGGSLWDFAATACLFGEAGAVAGDVYGAPLDLNRPDSTFMHHRGVVFATDADLASRVRGLFAPG